MLIVDNGSSDHTRAVVTGACLTNITLRYTNEPTPGLCRARNRGLRETKGEIIVFTDDDVIVPTNWIISMSQPILSGVADAVAGGVIFPPAVAAVLARPPFSSLKSWFASSEELDPAQPSRMIGANMAFHRRVLTKVPGYDIELGAGTGTTGTGEETLFSRQLLATGYKIAGALDVAVEHHFDVTRLSHDCLVDAAHKMGRTHAFIFYHWEHQKSRFARHKLIFSQISERWRKSLCRMIGTSGKISLRGLRAEQAQAFYREYLALRQRPHKYQLRGLAPVSSEINE